MKFQGNILFHLSKSAVQMRCNALLAFCYQFLIYSSLSCTLHGRYMLTAAYLLAIQCYTRAGGKVSVILIKYEKNQGEESSAASLVYKVILIFSWMLRIFCFFSLSFISFFAVAGFWSLFCAVIYWVVLSCTLA